MIQVHCHVHCNPMTAQTKIYTDLKVRLEVVQSMLSDWMYMVYTWYSPGIYQYILSVYTLCICSVYTWYIHSTVHIQLYTRNIHCIYYMVYTMEQTHDCFTMYILAICKWPTYHWNIPCIYHVYTMHIQLYTRNIHCIYYMVYTQYIPWNVLTFL